MTDQPTTPPSPISDEPKATHGDETFEWTGEAGSDAPQAASSGQSQGREWLNQLQTMIENAATQAAPVMREVAAKAAELAAVAGEKAGPVAARAAELTAEAGHRIAERSRDLASELRRDQAAKEGPGTSPADDSVPPSPGGTPIA